MTDPTPPPVQPPSTDNNNNNDNNNSDEATASGIITVNFRCLDGRTLSLDLPLDVLISDVKELLSESLSVEASRLRLIYHGQPLSDSSPLSAYVNVSGNTIHVVVRHPPTTVNENVSNTGGGVGNVNAIMTGGSQHPPQQETTTTSYVSHSATPNYQSQSFAFQPQLTGGFTIPGLNGGQDANVAIGSIEIHAVGDDLQGTQFAGEGGGLNAQAIIEAISQGLGNAAFGGMVGGVMPHSVTVTTPTGTQTTATTTTNQQQPQQHQQVWQRFSATHHNPPQPNGNSMTVSSNVNPHQNVINTLFNNATPPTITMSTSTTPSLQVGNIPTDIIRSPNLQTTITPDPLAAHRELHARAAAAALAAHEAAVARSLATILPPTSAGTSNSNTVPTPASPAHPEVRVAIEGLPPASGTAIEANGITASPIAEAARPVDESASRESRPEGQSQTDESGTSSAAVTAMSEAPNAQPPLGTNHQQQSEQQSREGGQLGTAVEAVPTSPSQPPATPQSDLASAVSHTPDLQQLQQTSGGPTAMNPTGFMEAGQQQSGGGMLSAALSGLLTRLVPVLTNAIQQQMPASQPINQPQPSSQPQAAAALLMMPTANTPNVMPTNGYQQPQTQQQYVFSTGPLDQAYQQMRSQYFNPQGQTHQVQNMRQLPPQQQHHHTSTLPGQQGASSLIVHHTPTTTSAAAAAQPTTFTFMPSGHQSQGPVFSSVPSMGMASQHPTLQQSSFVFRVPPTSQQTRPTDEQASGTPAGYIPSTLRPQLIQSNDGGRLWRWEGSRGDRVGNRTASESRWATRRSSDRSGRFESPVPRYRTRSPSLDIPIRERLFKFIATLVNRCQTVRQTLETVESGLQDTLNRVRPSATRGERPSSGSNAEANTSNRPSSNAVNRASTRPNEMSTEGQHHSQQQQQSQSQMIFLSHEGVSSLLPWGQLNSLMNFVEREMGWRRPRTEIPPPATCSTPPIAVFLSIYQQVMMVINGLLGQVGAWQTGYAELEVPQVGQLVRYLSYTSEIDAQLAAIFADLFSHMASRVSPHLLNQSMHWSDSEAQLTRLLERSANIRTRWCAQQAAAASSTAESQSMHSSNRRDRSRQAVLTTSEEKGGVPESDSLSDGDEDRFVDAEDGSDIDSHFLMARRDSKYGGRGTNQQQRRERAFDSTSREERRHRERADDSHKTLSPRLRESSYKRLTSSSAAHSNSDIKRRRTSQPQEVRGDGDGRLHRSGDRGASRRAARRERYDRSGVQSPSAAKRGDRSRYISSGSPSSSSELDDIKRDDEREEKSTSVNRTAPVTSKTERRDLKGNEDRANGQQRKQSASGDDSTVEDAVFVRQRQSPSEAKGNGSDKCQTKADAQKLDVKIASQWEKEKEQKGSASSTKDGQNSDATSPASRMAREEIKSEGQDANSRKNGERTELKQIEAENDKHKTEDRDISAGEKGKKTESKKDTLEKSAQKIVSTQIPPKKDEKKTEGKLSATKDGKRSVRPTATSSTRLIQAPSDLMELAASLTGFSGPPSSGAGNSNNNTTNPFDRIMAMMNGGGGGNASRMMSAAVAHPQSTIRPDSDGGLSSMPTEVRERYSRWTSDPVAFSRLVIPGARQRPFSNAYRSGDIVGGAGSQRSPAAASLFDLGWMQSTNRFNLPDGFEPPEHLRDLYLHAMLSDVAEVALSNPDYSAEPDRFPNLRDFLQQRKENGK